MSIINYGGGNTMKKTILFTLVCALMLMLVACGITDSSYDDKLPIQDVVTSDEAGQAEPEMEEEEPVKEESDQATIQEQVIYDENDIKITAKALEYDDWFGPSITVLVENNSQHNITVQTRNSSVNGLMIETLFSCDVAAGKKANDSITFYDSDLEMSGITTIKDIEFSLYIFDSDDWDDIAESDIIVLTTSADESFVQEYNAEGFVAYEDESYKIVVQKLDSEDSFWGSDIYVYIENNGDKNITVQTRDVSINGFMLDPMFSCDIMAGKKAYDTISFFESDLEDNGITDITEMEVKFNIFNSDTWNDIYETDAITISFE